MLTQAVQRLDHVAIIVYLENVETYVEKISRVLGVTFDEPCVVESTGVKAALSWDSGLEILAPLKREGRFWDRLQKHGEGACILVFGVADIEASKQRARDNDISVGEEVKLGGTEPWYDLFSTFREVGLGLFDPGMPVSLGLSQIIPAAQD